MFDSGAVQVPDGNPASDTLFLQVVTQPVRTKCLFWFLCCGLCSVLQELIKGAIGCMTYTWACELGYQASSCLLKPVIFCSLPGFIYQIPELALSYRMHKKKETFLRLRHTPVHALHY